MKNNKVLVAQLGARKHYQEPLLFHQWGILDRLYTDFYAGDNAFIQRLRHSAIYNYLPNFIKKGLDRYEPTLKGAKIIHFPRFAYQYVQGWKKVSAEQASQICVWGGQTFCHRIIEHGLGDANVVYGFNSACLELFEVAKDKGIRCILDQTFADWQFVHPLLIEEEERWPGWSLSPFRVTTADLELMQREHFEQDLADGIICGSNFVKDSLLTRRVAANKVTVVPLGRLSNEKLTQHQSTSQVLERGNELRILFVGSVGLRKGIPYLLQALRQIKNKIPFTCKVAGSLEITPDRVAEYSDVCHFMGRIPRSQIKDLYEWADVFVLPSICEGSAMVTYEALISGVPVITTYNSGAVVRDEIDGFIVPIRNVEAIAEKLLKIHAMKQNYFETKLETQEYLQHLFQESENQLYQLLMG